MSTASIIKTLSAHKRQLRHKYGVSEISLFGSRARGTNKRTSDVDLLVTFDGPASLLALSSLECYLSGLLGRKADVVPKEDLRPELREAVFREVIPV